MAEARAWISALRDSHDRLLRLLEGLEPEQLSRPSECSEWTIAQVLSHLGSGAEIFSLILDAGLTDSEAPGNEAFPPIWDQWNAKDPTVVVEDFKRVDSAFVEHWEGMDDNQLAAFKIAIFGMDLDASGLLALRLSEHALHSWDVAAALDPGAKVSQAATDLLVDGLVRSAGRGGKPVGGPLRVHLETSNPHRRFTLSVDENVLLAPHAEGDSLDGVAALEIPAEALLRLVSGRMDPDHTPAEVKADGVSLDSLRAVFPGF